ncbi:MAG: hypothetical protein D4R44_07350 [Actinobacteria bacterium]|nr:MAG: hypothetical protein D4R44_07350 [Actinomycetota bacterium]
MAAPKHTPLIPTNLPRTYQSPDHVPDSWMIDRPGMVQGRQPRGSRLGNQGPDQGFVLSLARRVRKQVRVKEGESLDDAIQGTVAIALSRASKFGRAPVMHDLTFALIIWGWLLESPPADLLAKRREAFLGIGNVVHHYGEGRALVDMVPSTTYELSNDQLTKSMPMSWRALTGA